MSKKLIIAVVVVLVAIVAFVKMGGNKVATNDVADQSADSLNQELDGLNDVDLGAELNGIDANVSKL